MRHCNKKKVLVLACLCFLVAVLRMNYASIDNDSHAPSPGNREQREKADDSRRKIILFWGKFYKENWDQIIETGHHNCRGGRSCTFTVDRSMYQLADAVVLHGASTRPEDTPDPSTRPGRQRWVFHNMEPFVNETYGSPRLRGIFNWTHTYHRASDVQNTQGRMSNGRSFKGFEPDKNYVRNRTKTAVTVMDHCSVHQIHAIRRLRKYLDLDIYGNCGHKNCLLEDGSCQKKLQKYKFYLAFEGDLCMDYMTGNMYTIAFANQLVPVVMGGANYSDPFVAPPGSYINGLGFKTTKALARFLKKVSESDRLYNSYFEWHSSYCTESPGYLSYNKLTNTASNFCNLCEALYDTSRPRKGYENIIDWFDKVNSCKPELYKLNQKLKLYPKYSQ